MFEKEESRKICEGCITGNYFLCQSFPGVAKKHAKREIDYRKWKAKRTEHSGGQAQTYYREDEL